MKYYLLTCTLVQIKEWNKNKDKTVTVITVDRHKA